VRHIKYVLACAVLLPVKWTLLGFVWVLETLAAGLNAAANRTTQEKQ
jgi:hypothetical protein